MHWAVHTYNVPYDRILENLPFGHKQTLNKTQLKIFMMFFFAHLDKATTVLSSQIYFKIPDFLYIY